MKANSGTEPASQPLPKGPNCWECRYLVITWNVRMPYGCKMMGFRSKVIPSLEVLRTDGRFCGGFAPKLPKIEAQEVSKKAVGKSSKSQKTDSRRRIFHINLIT